MKIDVVQEDINHGKRENPLACPIALAIGRSIGTVSVEVNTVRSKTHWVYLPMKAQVFIRDFDAGKLVQPFSFELDDWIKP